MFEMLQKLESICLIDIINPILESKIKFNFHEGKTFRQYFPRERILFSLKILFLVVSFHTCFSNTSFIIPSIESLKIPLLANRTTLEHKAWFWYQIVSQIHLNPNNFSFRKTKLRKKILLNLQFFNSTFNAWYFLIFWTFDLIKAFRFLSQAKNNAWEQKMGR